MNYLRFSVVFCIGTRKVGQGQNTVLQLYEN